MFTCMFYSTKQSAVPYNFVPVPLTINRDNFKLGFNDLTPWLANYKYQELADQQSQKDLNRSFFMMNTNFQGK